jgi:lipopolysaccharide transport system ATP-binding protein
MSAVVLDVQGVGKCYATYRSVCGRFLSWFGVKTATSHEFWAVRNVSFSLRAGEALALIGSNGAGKSTLLKLVTGTVRPSTGTIAITARISSILELGLGFNPEFTGRQNVHFAAGLMGFSRRQIEDLMPSIVEFAELGDFFDQTLRVYSSGMQARLAFSVATAVRPDVLIVDEVLSVGDSYFQHKSFDRIRQFKEQGTAILFVTHSMADVRVLCDRVILLDKGAILKDGSPDEVCDYYNALVAQRESATVECDQQRTDGGWLRTRSGTGQAVIAAMSLHDADSAETVAIARVGQPLRLRIAADVHCDIPQLTLGTMLRDRTGHVVWGSNTFHSGQSLSDVRAGQQIAFDLAFPCLLGPGSYSFSVALVSGDTHIENNFEWIDNALVFEVVNAGQDHFIGSCWLDGKYTVVPAKP